MKVPRLTKYFSLLGEKKRRKSIAIPIADRAARERSWQTPIELL